VPRTPGPRVQRAALLRRLEAAGEPLVLLVAPSGFGKTSLLAEWATTTGAQFAWLSCDETDGEPARFWSRLTPAWLRGLPAHNAPRETPGALHRVLLVIGTADGRTGVLSPELPGVS
jgi:LuxR family transcriptional regulator, maltose regulon positive regulatory protein